MSVHRFYLGVYLILYSIQVFDNNGVDICECVLVLRLSPNNIILSLAYEKKEKISF